MTFETIPAKELDWYVHRPEAMIIDVRLPEDYRKEHVEGAINYSYEEFDREDFERRLRLPRNKTLVLYCERGSTSMLIARELGKRGYRVKSVAGGILAYRGSHIIYGR